MRVGYGLATWLLAAAGAAAQSLHGTVRDATGAPVGDAVVSVTCDRGTATETRTGRDGHYTFAQLPPCVYTLVARQGALSATLTVAVPAGGTTSTRDAVLAASPSPSSDTTRDLAANPAQTPGPNASSTPAASPGPPRPKFEASGIRGLVDPGGYSAPANAAAASSLLAGLAAANRAGAAGCLPTRSVAELAAAHRANPADVATTLDYAEALLATEQFVPAQDALAAVTAAQGADRLARLRARAAEGQGQFPAAAQQYAALYARQHAPDDLFAEGYEQILNGTPAVAATLFREGLRRHPEAASLRIGLGVTAFLAGHAAEAIELFLGAAESNPADPRPYPLLAAAGGVSPIAGDRVAAALNRHLTLAPTDATGYLALAVTLQRKGADPDNAARAEAALRRALTLDPGLGEAHALLGSLLARRAAHGEAVRELQMAAALDPDRREIRYRLAQELRLNGQGREAAEEMGRFQQARAEDATAGSDVTRYLSVMGRSATCRPR